MSETSKQSSEPVHITYWDIVEAALTTLPEDGPYREQALRAFDHLKERVLAGRETSNQEKSET